MAAVTRALLRYAFRNASCTERLTLSWHHELLITLACLASAQLVASATMLVNPSHSVMRWTMDSEPRILAARIEHPALSGPKPPHIPAEPNPSFVCAAATPATPSP